MPSWEALEAPTELPSRSKMLTRRSKRLPRGSKTLPKRSKTLQNVFKTLQDAILVDLGWFLNNLERILTP